MYAVLYDKVYSALLFCIKPDTNYILPDNIGIMTRKVDVGANLSVATGMTSTHAPWSCERIMAGIQARLPRVELISWI